jgi:hypothetical protein
VGAYAIYPFTESQSGVSRVVGARLAEFGVGSDKLQEAHKKWINDYLGPQLSKHPNAWIDLHGFASNTGKVQANLELSRRRILAVETALRARVSGVRINIRNPQGVRQAVDDNAPGNKEDGYYRAVLVRWFGIPLDIPAPKLPKDPEPKYKTYKAPPGCWCIVAADSIGLPVKAGISIGKVEFKLLNDKGQLFSVVGAGAGAGLGLSVGPKSLEEAEKLGMKALNWIKEVALKAGDLPNAYEKIKELNLTGPSETNGPVLKNLTWAASIPFSEIVKDGIFVVGMGEAQFIAAGAEVGLVIFGVPNLGRLNPPWGFYSSLGLGTLKGALGTGITAYAIISSGKIKDQVRGASDL